MDYISFMKINKKVVRKMDTSLLSTFSEFISSYGFPIAMCVAMFVYMWYTNKKHSDEIAELYKEHREEIAEMNKQHKEETDKLSEAVNNNTLVCQQLVNIYNRGDKD